jgi:hypothetical protein
MQIATLVSLINQKLAGEALSQTTLLPYIDEVLDDINHELNSVFPTMSEFLSNAENGPTYQYNMIPDKYFRSVVVYGAAAKFYATDEEGEMSAEDYAGMYRKNTFLMVRDFITQIPEAYQAPETGYYEPEEGLERGLWVYNGLGGFYSGN